ncbi:CDP-alcohol phosphatidyltransferase family protein [Actinomadura craniellae]|uniref:CDP-alcohol phosphatidyltransferase family protein n=1 Tax=Actinomadura craniellae TaxID=2231787 RepID=UPI0013140C7D|nr:CDP-alcohol phosphatidyltransferase family protein [Actinomadura craniellae]
MAIQDVAMEFTRNAMNDRGTTRMRRVILRLAVVIDRIGRGRITANTVTAAGVGIQALAAGLVALGHLLPGALLLAVSLPADLLDGELARLQGRASARGMLLDATADRVSEVVLFCGIAYHLTMTGPRGAAVWAVAACGAALCVSYVKAKGEAAIATREMTHDALNRIFQMGLAPLTNRKRILILGLVVDQLLLATIAVALLSSITIGQRWVAISQRL